MSRSSLRAPYWTFPFTLTAILVMASRGHATQILVPSQQPTIQAGIDAAVNGDEVVIADGTYTGAGNVNCSYGGKLITVRSASGNPQACIIDCQGTAGTRAFLFNSGETGAAVLKGITITGGAGASPGGAVRIDGASPAIEHCRFVTNLNDAQGRAIACINGGNPTISDCFFQANQPLPGGTAVSSVVLSSPALATGSSLLIARCTFFDNKYSSAINCAFGSQVTIRDCRFIANGIPLAAPQLLEGGGIRCQTQASVVAVNCLFESNVARSGGAVSAIGANAHVELINCTVSANEAFPTPGVTTEGGGGVWVRTGGHVTLRNSIVWNNSPTNLQTSPTLGGTFDVQFSNVEDGPVGEGTFDLFPLFVNPNGPDHIIGTLDDDYSLTSLSPCIDSGDNAAATAAGLVTDLAGNPRFVDDPASPDIGSGRAPLVDMGCYEFQPAPVIPCSADINGDGVVNTLDLGILLSSWTL